MADLPGDVIFCTSSLLWFVWLPKFNGLSDTVLAELSLGASYEVAINVVGTADRCKFSGRSSAG